MEMGYDGVIWLYCPFCGGAMLYDRKRVKFDYTYLTTDKFCPECKDVYLGVLGLHVGSLSLKLDAPFIDPPFSS